MLLRLARFALGVALGLGLWMVTASPYNSFVARGTGTLLRFDSRFADADVSAGRARMTLLPPSDAFPTAILSVGQLTYNVVLLVALFASNDRSWRGGNAQALLISLILIAALRPGSAFGSAESTYANQKGRWSEQNFSMVAAVWRIAETFYRLVGMFGAVFICWWLVSQPNASKASARARRRGPITLAHDSGHDRKPPTGSLLLTSHPAHRQRAKQSGRSTPTSSGSLAQNT